MKRMLLGFLSVAVIEAPSETAYVTVSLKDVNRIYCESGDVGVVVYSKEKRIEVIKEGRNVFVKFLPVKKGLELRYEKVPRDMYIECGGEVFSLILVPADIPARTIVLRSKKKKVEEVYAFESGEFTKVIGELISFAYRDIVPDGYEEKKVGKLFKEFKELDMYLLKVYEGVRFSVLIFGIRAKKDIELDPVMFIPYVKYPVALSLSKERLKKGEEGRLFVVVRRDV